MGEITIYGLKNCDTCRKAMKALDGAGLAYTFVDVRADGVDPGTLKAWVAKLGVDVLVNTRSTTWRGLDEVSRSNALDAAEADGVMSTHPTLIKRPVIVAGDTVHVGWSKSVQAALLP